MSKQWKYTVSKNGRHQISELGGGNVCMIWNCKNKESNAHLIKTSPKMYKMLEMLSGQLTDINAHHAAKEIDELLAEARGEK